MVVDAVLAEAVAAGTVSAGTFGKCEGVEAVLTEA